MEKKLQVFGSSICGFEGMYRFYRFSLGRDVQVFFVHKIIFSLVNVGKLCYTDIAVQRYKIFMP